MTLDSKGRVLAIWLVGPVFLGMAVWLAASPKSAPIPITPTREVSIESIRPGAWRTPLKHANEAKINGAVRPCSECHRLFGTPPEENRTLIQHKDIVLAHGMNRRCLNCHYGADRDKLVLHDGTLVDFNETPRLCSNCHGTVYRDWQLGMHGKTTGSWDTSNGNQQRLACNECHDPHAPRYQAFEPLPGPVTLRMGDTSRVHEPNGKHEPLRRWSTPAHGDGGHGKPAHDGDHKPKNDDGHEDDAKSEPKKENPS